MSKLMEDSVKAQLDKFVETSIDNSQLADTSSKKKKKKKNKKSKDESLVENTASKEEKKPKKKGKLNAKLAAKLREQKELLKLQEEEEKLLKAEEEETQRLYNLELEANAKKQEEDLAKIRQLKKEKKEKQKLRQKEAQRQQMLARLGINIDNIKTDTKKAKKQSNIYKKRKKQHKVEPKTPEAEEDTSVPDSWEDEFDSWEDRFDDKPKEEMAKIELEEEEVEEIKEPVIKSPICCILGNVDAGKTTLVDKIKSTQVQKHEAGGITQKINTIFVKFNENKFNIPGVILIDTPGHDSFYNLRSFGASLCNFVILMVDIMEGIKEQTIKSIDLIKENKIPYVIVANKVDRLNMWNTITKLPITKSYEKQCKEAQVHYDSMTKQLINQFANLGLNAKLSYDNKDTKTFASIYPVSAYTGEGIPDLFMGIMKLMTNHMKQDLEWKPDFEGVLTDTTIMKGLGKCINLLVYNGQIERKDTLVLTGINGPVVKPITKLGIKDGNNFELHENISATADVSAVVKSSNETNYVIGSPVYLISNKLNKKDIIIQTNKASKAIETYLETKTKELAKKTSKYGVIVFASSFGGLTAIIEHLEKNNIPYIDAKVGTIKKTDIIKLTGFNNKPETQIYNVVIAFDTKIDERAQHECYINPNITLIQDNIIYRVFDDLKTAISSKQGNIKQQYEKMISHPCILQILPEHIIAKRKPIILGVKVTKGILKKGSHIQVLKKKKKEYKTEADICSLGIVVDIKSPKGEDLDEATVNKDVSVRIESELNESDKLYGRDFDADTPLWTKMTYDSRNIMMKYFYDDMEPSEKSAFHNLSDIYRFEKSVEKDSEEEYW